LPDFVSTILARASKLAEECESGSLGKKLEIVGAVVRRITIAQDQVTIEFDRNGLAGCLLHQQASSESRAKDHPSVLIEVPVRFRRRGVEAKLVVLNQQQAASEPNANLVKALHALMSGSTGSCLARRMV
jgi:hypothetical protein